MSPWVLPITELRIIILLHWGGGCWVLHAGEATWIRSTRAFVTAGARRAQIIASGIERLDAQAPACRLSDMSMAGDV
jgi:hypothetical protein